MPNTAVEEGIQAAVGQGHEKEIENNSLQSVYWIFKVDVQ
jgi:hypothetical protein